MNDYVTRSEWNEMKTILERIETKLSEHDRYFVAIRSTFVSTELRFEERLRHQGILHERLEKKVDAVIEVLDTKASASHVAALETKIDAVEARVSRLEAKVDAVDAKVDAVDAKVDAVDAKVDAVDAKVDGLSAKFDGLNAKFDGLESKVDTLGSKLDVVIGLVRK